MPDPPSARPDPGRPDGAPRLSGRELQTLRLLAEGRSTAQIAAALSVSPNTARTRVHRLRAKLGATGRQQVVPRARGLGLLGVSDPGPAEADRPSPRSGGAR